MPSLGRCSSLRGVTPRPLSRYPSGPEFIPCPHHPLCSACARWCIVVQVDLRSATEIERDELIHAGVYDGFMTIEDDDLRIWDGHTWDKTMARRINELFCGGSVEMEGGEEGDEPRGVGGESKSKSKSKRRYFVSLIDESVYKKAVFFRLRRRHKVCRESWEERVRSSVDAAEIEAPSKLRWKRGRE